MASVARITAIMMGLLLVLPVYGNLPDRIYGLPLAIVGLFVYLGFVAARGHRLASGILASMLVLVFVSVPLIIILDSLAR